MKRDVSIIIGLALIAVAVGAFIFIRGRGLSDGSLSATADTQRSAVAVSFTPLVSGSRSKVANRVNYIITSSAQLDELWKMIDATSTPPAIDFKTDSVIAVFAGQHPTTGFTIEVSKIQDAAARLVSITITRPGCALTYPPSTTYELVQVSATSLPLTHEDISATTSCPR